MVHQSLPSLKELYTVLHDDDAFFFFHVDSKAGDMNLELKTWLGDDPLVRNRCNHAVMPTPANVLWGRLFIN
jgi:hypothetical protein